jgi:SUMO ligase MMS21 Smc5/6 complex component
MELHEYPEAIASAQHLSLKQKQEIYSLQAELDHLSGQIDYAIAFDVELKNDLQRKAKRFELMNSDEYIQIDQALQAAKYKLAELEIEQQRLLNQFSVAKLEARQQIAQTNP